MLTGFTAGLLLITVSELGDKTFFIAMILASRYSREIVMIGVVAALALMTVLSVLIGQFATFLPERYITYLEISLFIGFGLKQLYDASQMSSINDGDEEKEAAQEVQKRTKQLSDKNPQFSLISTAFLMTFLAEWGDRTQIATITLSASNPPIGVTLGAVLGHTICAAIAVIGGKMLAKHISERVLVAVGGGLFLIFAAVAWLQG
ncbi:MAG: TMEM165/GDT1 family protein [Chroococcales cyanobacterium]